MFRIIMAVLVYALMMSISFADPIVTQSTSTSTVTTTTKGETQVKSPPPSAITPSINASNSDLCTVGVAGAVQTQILGISGGTTVTDENCERLKLSKTIYDMGMKVAAVSIMCQDKRVFDAMKMAGTPCPYKCEIGEKASYQWAKNPADMPTYEKDKEHFIKKCKKERIGFISVDNDSFWISNESFI